MHKGSWKVAKCNENESKIAPFCLRLGFSNDLMVNVQKSNCPSTVIPKFVKDSVECEIGRLMKMQLFTLSLGFDFIGQICSKQFAARRISM